MQRDGLYFKKNVHIELDVRHNILKYITQKKNHEL